MVDYDYWPFLKEDLISLYKYLGEQNSLKKDLSYLEKSYKTVEKLWRQQYEAIKTINYIMLSEAPLFGDKQSYFYNEKVRHTQFFYCSDATVLTKDVIRNKRDLIDSFNSLGIIILDVFPFAFNEDDTAVSYRNFTTKNNKVIVDLTYENYLKPKLQLIAKKTTPSTKVFYRYERVKKVINGFIVPELKNFGINITEQEIPSIAKQGGGIDRESLKKIFAV